MEYNKNEEQAQVLTSDVYFLIQRFLSSGPLTKTLKVLNEELEQYKILPKRVDWEGNQHERTVEDMERQFPYIRPDYLKQLCYQAISSTEKPSSKSLTSFLSFKPKVAELKKTLRNFDQLCNYVIRYHGVPRHNLKEPFNLVNSLRGREVSGPFSRQRAVSSRLYSSVQIQRITLGHLSAVYCILFDHSGKYIITGADDLLIKLWSAHTGRLIAAFRGASSEITDIAINLENTLLAAGSIDRILRVWNLQTGAPVAVLTGHTGMITSVNFCPTACWGLRYLISTSTDGSVAFWTYTYDSGGKVEFRLTPILYQEKVRPGQAQMICSSFSPGGTFLATGSADHHVRIYYMKGDDGPQRILETESHRDRVDSIQWAHSGLRLVSGSKDGTAIIWWFERQQWKTLYLNMTTKLANKCECFDSSWKKVPEDPKKMKVTMVAWDLSDTHVITAVSDHTLKVWTSSDGQLEKVLSGHTDEIYVLESHPHDAHLILSAGHDGQLFLWDIAKGEIIYRFLNTIEGQGYGAIFDVKFSPDGSVIGATDSHGHVLTFGFGTGSPFYEQLPKDLFFHTDYRPLVRDSNHYVLDEQTQIPPHLMPPPFLVDIDGNPYPPTFQRLVPGREHCNVEQLVPNIVIGNEGTQEVIQDIPEGHARQLEENNIRGNASTAFRSGRRNREMERIRQSTGDWQTDPNIEWKKNVLVQALRRPQLQRARNMSEFIKDAEIEEYLKQLRQRPHMICTSTSNNVKAKEKEKKNKHAKYHTRSTCFYIKSNSESSESSSHDSSGYSDWMEEEGVNLQRQKRSRRRNAHDSISDPEDEEVEEEEEDEKEVPADRSNRRNVLAEKAEAARLSAAAPSTSTSAPKRSKMKVSEQYRLSEWLSETKPRKSPYYPQIGDEIVYFIQGHQLYLDAVKLKNIYEINTKDLPWTKMAIKDHECVKVIGIQYEIKPPRLCCLKLAMLDEEGQLTGKTFVVKYHDMPDVLDFFVLKQTYITSVSRVWAPDDKFRCMIDDEWWIGQIIENSPVAEQYPNSPFMCFEIKWYNGERERMSPWDLEPIDEERIPEDESKSLPVLEHELNSILYKSVPEDWPNNDRSTVCKFILAGLTKVMELAIAEPFLVPVDLSIYPTYAVIIEYPIDLSTIKARFENNFYRRLTAAQFDIRYLATNAEKFNERHSLIIKHAKILTELCLRIVKQCSGYVDVPVLYHQLVDTYDSSATEDEVEIMPSSSRTLRILPSRHFRHANDWKVEAQNLLDAMWNCEDSVPFRAPVNLLKYPDYHHIVKTPIDLGTVKEKLLNDQYDVPQQFSDDVKLIFGNSRSYNTNKRSRIYVMTVRLAAMFEDCIRKILYTYKIAKRRQQKVKRNRKNSQSTCSSSSISSDAKDSSEAVDDIENLSVNVSKQSEHHSDSDDMPLKVFTTKVNNESSSTTSNEKLLPPASHENDSGTTDSEDSYKPKLKSDSDEDSEDSYKPKNKPRRTNRVIIERKRSTDSEDSYHLPSEAEYSGTHKERTTSSSSSDEDIGDEEEEELSSDNSQFHVRKSRRQRKSVRRKIEEGSSDDSEDEYSGMRTRKKPRMAVVSDSDSEKLENGTNDDGTYFTTVSSRGRLRKLTPRAQALLKKDKKFI